MRQVFQRWRAVWRGVSAADGDSIFLDLTARYAEPHRAYHTLEHIGECLANLDLSRHLAARPAEVELAVWFHDAIYDPRRNDNEELSALLAEETLQAVGSEVETARRVGDLIRLTTHTSQDLSGDEALLCDIDLSIFGAEPGRFAQYDDDIRQEYDWVPEDIYRRERTRVLQGFLKRSHIYMTPFFYNKLERRARTNIEGLLRIQSS